MSFINSKLDRIHKKMLLAEYGSSFHEHLAYDKDTNTLNICLRYQSEYEHSLSHGKRKRISRNNDWRPESTEAKHWKFNNLLLQAMCPPNKRSLRHELYLCAFQTQIVGKIKENLQCGLDQPGWISNYSDPDFCAELGIEPIPNEQQDAIRLALDSSKLTISYDIDAVIAVKRQNLVQSLQTLQCTGKYKPSLQRCKIKHIYTPKRSCWMSKPSCWM